MTDIAEVQGMSDPVRVDEGFTYADYVTWPDNERCELIGGEVYAMSSPSAEHQTICFEIGRQIGNYLVGKTCRIFLAPFDVRLNAAGADDTVVQPDILVVCDRRKIRRDCCVGAPDLVIEILSRSTDWKDRHKKFKTYRDAGVREYWIVDPAERIVTAFAFDSPGVVRHYTFGDAVPSVTLEGLAVDFAALAARI